MAIEEWRPIIGYEGLYEVSSLGRVRRLDGVTKSRWGGVRPWKGGIRKLHQEKSGYMQARLSREGNAKTLHVHALVCEAFHGRRPSDEHEVAHNDGSRDNNRADNLRWATAAENAADRKIHGTEREGEQISHVAKLTAEDVLAIRRQYKPGYGALPPLARRYGVTTAAICAVIKRKNWKHI